jgi:predicted HTH domain antitoxin
MESPKRWGSCKEGENRVCFVLFVGNCGWLSITYDLCTWECFCTGLYITVDIYCITVISLSETISLRLHRETIKKLREIANKEGKDRSTLIREILECGIKEKNIEHAIELYQTGQVTGWKAAQIAEISLWRFYKILSEKGILIQYSEQDLEEDLKA